MPLNSTPRRIHPPDCTGCPDCSERARQIASMTPEQRAIALTESQVELAHMHALRGAALRTGCDSRPEPKQLPTDAPRDPWKLGATAKLRATREDANGYPLPPKPWGELPTGSAA